MEIEVTFEATEVEIQPVSSDTVRIKVRLLPWDAPLLIDDLKEKVKRYGG